MGKLIGIFLGFLLVPYVGYLGILFGFLIGAYFDLRKRISTSGFFYSNNYGENILLDSFPVMAAYVTASSGPNRVTVLTVKNISMQLFNRHIVSNAMKNYKRYVENGVPSYILQNSCDNILYNFDYNSKLYILSLLATILKADGNFTNQKIYSLKLISTSIGIYDNDFEAFFYNYNQKHSYNDFSKTFFNEQDPYDILEINKNSTEEEIKKQFRVLCKKHHPDLTSNLTENEKKKSETKMKEIINAYEKIKKERGIK